jgi:hypothetical protein
MRLLELAKESVVPAEAGKHPDLAFLAWPGKPSKLKMDSSFRWDDDI